MGIEIDGPKNGFGDKNNIFKNVAIPHSTLKKRHNAIAYHTDCEAVASTSICITLEKGENNMSDCL